VKRAVEHSIGLRKMRVKSLWRRRPPPKRNKRQTTRSLRGRDVGAPATIRSLSRAVEKKNKYVYGTCYRLAPYQGIALDVRP
jgi:hypothetical protein